MDAQGWLGALGGLAGGAAAVYVAVRRRAIEKYVAELDRVSYEHEVVFSRLHEKRVDVIADLYKKLIAMEAAFSSWVSPMQPTPEAPRENMQGTWDVAREFESAFRENRIWLDKDLCERLDTINRELYEVFVRYSTYMRDEPRTSPEHRQEWLNAWKKVTEEIPPLRQDIEDRFREMLGVAAAR